MEAERRLMKSHLIKTIYLYVVSVIGVIMVVTGFIGPIAEEIILRGFFIGFFSDKFKFKTVYFFLLFLNHELLLGLPAKKARWLHNLNIFCLISP